MLIVMRMDATETQVEAVVRRIAEQGLEATPIVGTQRTAVAVTGNVNALDSGAFARLDGVHEVIPVGPPYRLVAREFKNEDTLVQVGDAVFGDGGLAVVGGPCAVESYDQLSRIAESVRNAGAQVLRAGAWKPRTSPYSFQGLGDPGLEILARVRKESGLPVVTEAMDVASLPRVAEVADMVQIGARNMYNYSLLKAAGRAGKPVLLKRSFTATLTELLLAAEYILAEGNDQVVLCERGIRTLSDHSRATLDLAILSAVEKVSHLPIIVDPSHAAGDYVKVPRLARAAVAAGTDGLMIEVHDQPQNALSDGRQAILPEVFADLVADVRRWAEVPTAAVAVANS